MRFSNRLADVRQQLLQHPVYHVVDNAPALRTFMRAHVFCVWDFQSILKTLQRKLTTVTVPWLPSADAEARRLINEIVLEEESDIDPDGGYVSHYEFYLRAMHECGADSGPIENLIASLQRGQDVLGAINENPLPGGVGQFLNTTFDVLLHEPLHCQVALFAYSREDMIPDMFVRLVEFLEQVDNAGWTKFLYYLNRHIEIDGERHGPIAQALLERICADDALKWQQAENTIVRALQARIRLWDAIVADIRGADAQAVI